MGVVGRLDEYQRRHRWAGLPIAVLWKFIDDEATYLAALITYYGFLSLFPLLLLALTVLGFVLQGDPALQQALLTSALRNFPVVGDQIGENVRSLQGSVEALVVGIVVSIYGGLGVTVAVQNAFARMWVVPKAERPALPTAYARGALAVVVLALAIGTAAGLTALGALLPRLPSPLAGLAQVLLTLAGIAVNALLVVLAFRLLTPRPLTTRQVLPGAIVAAVAWYLLQTLGAYLVQYQLSGMNASYGVFGIVLGLLAWIYLSAVVALFCAEVNTVRVLGLSPRSLLSAFPDDTDTTPADERAFASYAAAERLKSFQTIDVDFDPTATPPRGQERP
ncbi:YihY/virulence factor BrkB family protein [Actinomycetospora chiangmaiensis]|uniref:YihY/virulence factor BrkB family protein n=1 Tax=Actinomycetospora chiangmaiensis TaxID=402650 RepID=UPI0003604B07|nr:YihY/virulence factor BrkB family protein [Actinomycetospora chiangmaiensis]